MHLMEGAMELSGYVRKYVASLLKTSIQAREFFLITRYYLIIKLILNHQFFQSTKGVRS